MEEAFDILLAEYLCGFQWHISFNVVKEEENIKALIR